MSQVAISGNASGTGTLTIAAPNTNSNYTLNLPAATGTVMVSGNMPAFSAYQSSVQTISAATLTKVQLQTEEFDTNSNFDNATNYRFTPTVAGYYQISGAVSDASAGTNHVTTIYKNGAEFKRGSQISYSGAAPTQGVVSALIYFNGSTDYVELYVFMTSGSTLSATNFQTYFQGVMVRGA
jgi:hypothetical protein